MALCICVGALSEETNPWVSLIFVINPHTIFMGHMSLSSLLTPQPGSHWHLLACHCSGCSMKRASSLGVLNVVDKATGDLYQVRSLTVSLAPSFTSLNLYPFFFWVSSPSPSPVFIFLPLSYTLSETLWNNNSPMVLLVVICGQAVPCPCPPVQSSQKLVTNVMTNMFLIVCTLIYKPLVTTHSNEWCAR
jgi:hypothetical protein